FVARTRDAAPPKFEAGTAKLDPNQEVFHYDPQAKLYRRLTDTGGHAYAINVAPDRKALMFLTVNKLERSGTEPPRIVDPQGGFIDLTTLETVGPLPIKGSSVNYALYFTGKGEPVWDGADPMQVDAAHTALVKVDRAQVAADATTN